jgi:hypothetical protein
MLVEHQCTFMILASIVDVIIQTFSNLIFVHREAKQHRPVRAMAMDLGGFSGLQHYYACMRHHNIWP